MLEVGVLNMYDSWTPKWNKWPEAVHNTVRTTPQSCSLLVTSSIRGVFKNTVQTYGSVAKHLPSKPIALVQSSTESKFAFIALVILDFSYLQKGHRIWSSYTVCPSIAPTLSLSSSPPPDVILRSGAAFQTQVQHTSSTYRVDCIMIWVSHHSL